MEKEIVEKELYCPVCGTRIKQFRDMHDTYHVRAGCPECKYTTFLCDPEEVWDKVEELINTIFADKKKDGKITYTYSSTEGGFIPDCSPYILIPFDDEDCAHINMPKARTYVGEGYTPDECVRSVMNMEYFQKCLKEMED